MTLLAKNHDRIFRRPTNWGSSCAPWDDEIHQRPSLGCHDSIREPNHIEKYGLNMRMMLGFHSNDKRGYGYGISFDFLWWSYNKLLGFNVSRPTSSMRPRFHPPCVGSLEPRHIDTKFEASFGGRTDYFDMPLGPDHGAGRAWDRKRELFNTFGITSWTKWFAQSISSGEGNR